MYKFEPILKQLIWGGNRILSFKQISSHLHEVGESWELSAVPGDLSVVANGPERGTTIVELIEKYRERLVGQHNYAQHGNRFPLLIKFIDAQHDLSIQVHPNDALARQRHGTNGKSEMWYVIDADRGARLCSGLAQPITQEEYMKRISEGTFADVLHYDEVRPGDVYYMPAGRVHSIGAGCFIAEIQQTSNITYRIFDYNRRDAAGNKRELHTRMAKDAIDYKVQKEYRIPYTRALNKAVTTVECPYFTTLVCDLTEPIERDYAALDSFVIYICVAGRAQLVDNTSRQTLTIRMGETVLVPAETKTVSIIPEGKVKLLETFC